MDLYENYWCADFHHVDTSEKDVDINMLMYNVKWDKLKIKLDKCILLCSNCHRYKHYDIDRFGLNKETILKHLSEYHDKLDCQ